MDGITFRTTDGGRWGAGGGTGTGGNLTPLQFDENNWELLTRMQALEDNPPVAVSIQSFTRIGSQFQVNLTDGSHQGPFDLPIATFRDVGEWDNSMPLLALDLFRVPGFGLYMVKIGHTTPASPATFNPDALDPDTSQPLYSLIYGEQEYIYDLGFSFPGRPGIGVEADAAVATHVFVHAVTAPVDLTGSEATLEIAAGGDLSFPILIAGAAAGSVDFAAGETAGTFTFTDAVEIAIGDKLRLIRPDAVDTDARELSVTFKMIRTF